MLCNGHLPGSSDTIWRGVVVVVRVVVVERTRVVDVILTVGISRVRGTQPPVVGRLAYVLALWYSITLGVCGAPLANIVARLFCYSPPVSYPFSG